MAHTIVIGDGPGGLSAALFLAKSGQDVTVYGMDQTAMNHAYLYNYLGIFEIDGTEFQQIARAQVTAFGASLAAEQVTAALRPKGTLYFPETAVVAVEQTANFGGGAIWPLDQLRAVAAVAEEAGVATHMDGARLLNACIATGVSAKDYADGYDTVWIDFTKGLGAPMGAALAGPTDLIARAWRVRQRIGGGLRQSGFMAATCLYALEHHVERLTDDHALASEIGRALATMPMVASVLPVETNIVIFTIAEGGLTAAALVDRLRDDGVRVGAFGERQVRIVTHIGVDAADGRRLCESLSKHLAS